MAQSSWQKEHSFNPFFNRVCLDIRTGYDSFTITGAPAWQNNDDALFVYVFCNTAFNDECVFFTGNANKCVRPPCPKSDFVVR